MEVCEKSHPLPSGISLPFLVLLPPTFSILSLLSSWLLSPFPGLGNQLFQLAAVHVFAYDIGVPCVVGFFEHWNRRYETFEPWGGHTPPVPGVSLKDTFPGAFMCRFCVSRGRACSPWYSRTQPLLRLLSFSHTHFPLTSPFPTSLSLSLAAAFHWLTIEPEIHHPTVYNAYAFKIADPDEFLPMPQLSVFPAHIHGYFFNHRYWHHRRSHVLQILRLNPAIDDYIDAYYGDLFKTEREDCLGAPPLRL